MIIYLAILFFCFISSLYVREWLFNISKEDKDSVRYSTQIKILYYVICASMILIVGLRGDYIGIDTQNYKRAYLIDTYSSFHDLNNLEIYEAVGYRFLSIFAGKLHISWHSFCIIIAAIYFVPIFQVIFEETENPFNSLMILILIGFFTFPMSTIKQSIAIGLTVEAIRFLKKDKLHICVILLIIASTFHTSALLCIIYIIIFKIPLKKNNWVLWAAVGLSIVIFGTVIIRKYLDIVLSLVEKVYEQTATGGLLLEIYYIITLFLVVIFGFANSDFIKTQKMYIISIYLTVILLPAVRTHPALLRLYLYFSIYEVILIPNFLRNIKNVKTRLMGSIAYFLVYLYLFFNQTLATSRMVTPYRFFWS